MSVAEVIELAIYRNLTKSASETALAILNALADHGYVVKEKG
jgi:hypothetical protein